MATSKTISPTTAALGEEVVDATSAFSVLNTEYPHTIFIALVDTTTDENTGWIPLQHREGATRATFGDQEGKLFIKASTPGAKASLTKNWA